MRARKHCTMSFSVVRCEGAGGRRVLMRIPSIRHASPYLHTFRQCFATDRAGRMACVLVRNVRPPLEHLKPLAGVRTLRISGFEKGGRRRQGAP